MRIIQEKGHLGGTFKTADLKPFHKTNITHRVPAFSDFSFRNYRERYVKYVEKGH